MDKKYLFIVSILCISFFTKAYGQIVFPDPAFKHALLTQSSNIDTNGDNEIDPSEAEVVTYLDVRGRDIRSLEGIEFFTRLRTFKLYTESRNLNEADFSSNTQLRSLWLNNSGISRVNVTNGNLLEYLYVSYNNLTNLDISTNTNLKYLEATGNEIAQINLSNNPNLVSAHLSHNKLTSINLQDTHALEKLYLVNNLLTHIDARDSALGSLSLRDNRNLQTAFLTNQRLVFFDDIGQVGPSFDNVDLKNTLNLKFICIDPEFVQAAEDRRLEPGHSNYSVSPDCSLAPPPSCSIIHFPDANFKQAILDYPTNIDTDGDREICIEEAKRVRHLSVHDKNISDLTGIEHFTEIRRLTVSRNQLTNLDFNSNSKLTSVNASANSINVINISNAPDLEELNVTSNELTQIDLRNNAKLKHLQAGLNQLTSIDLINNSNLETLDLRHNQLTSIDVRNITSLTILNLNNNDLEEAFLKGNHYFYNSLDVFIGQPRITRTYLSFKNNNDLRFLCVNDVPFFNQIVNYVHYDLGYLGSVVSTDCTPPVEGVFEDYFTLNPNPVTDILRLTKLDSSTHATTANVINSSGREIWTKLLLFGGKFGGGLGGGIGGFDENTAEIYVSDLAPGSYTLSVNSSAGILTKTFTKQ